jgi:hypothetical protein
MTSSPLFALLQSNVISDVGTTLLAIFDLVSDLSSGHLPFHLLSKTRTNYRVEVETWKRCDHFLSVAMENSATDQIGKLTFCRLCGYDLYWNILVISSLSSKRLFLQNNDRNWYIFIFFVSTLNVISLDEQILNLQMGYHEFFFYEISISKWVWTGLSHSNSSCA